MRAGTAISERIELGGGAARPTGLVRLRNLTNRLAATDRTVLGYWLVAHAALFTLAYTAAWVSAPDNGHKPLAGGFQQWDANLLQSVAAHGYFGPGSVPHNAAFFPGYPLALAAVHLALRNWIVSELLLSLVAGGVAVVAITRTAGTTRAALFLLTAPTAVFLTVGYSESLFLAFAIPAWNAGRRGAWIRCGCYASLAAFTRPDGLFLIPALAVMALTRPTGARRWRALLGVALGLLGPAVYELYLRSRTHSWSAWSQANQAGWGLHYVGPWQAIKTSYWAAFRHPFSGEYGFLEQLEIVCLAVMLIAAIGFAVRRRWPEAVYCGLAVIGLGTQ
ncbi:MAG TPA: mannosyltransferase family protein, partial [Streptosporangiaceae bacterium]